MKLARVRSSGKTIPVIIDSEMIDVCAITPDFDAAFFAENGIEKLSKAPLGGFPRLTHADSFAPPVATPSKLVCVGLNFHEHARESALPVPTEPVLFLKAPSALSGADDPILFPPDASRLDWEIELALCVSRRLRHVTAAEALQGVAGYMILNDVSERSFQFDRGGQWTKGKSYDSFAPAGPYLVTPDEVNDARNLSMRLKINGEVMQNGNTRDMIFSVGDVLSYISRHMTLEPGDIVSTGTPSGVGFGRKPQLFLQPGDALELEIAGLGVQRTRVIADTVTLKRSGA